MRLVATVLGFLLRKLGVLLAVVLVSFLGLLVISTLVPALREAEGQRDRLERVSREVADLEDQQAAQLQVLDEQVGALTTEVEAEVAEGGRKVSAARAEAERLRGSVGRICRVVVKIDDLVSLDTVCTTARDRAREAERYRDGLERELVDARDRVEILEDPDLGPEEKLERLGRSDQLREVKDTRSELDEATTEEKELQEAQGSVPGRVVGVWSQYWKWLVGIALVALLLPPVLRAVSYFLLMPLVSRAQRPILLASGSDAVTAELRAGPAERTLRVQLDADQVLSARSEHVRPVRGRARSQLLYDWRSPFISFASGLHSLSRVTGNGEGAETTLAAPDDPDAYLMRLDFEHHPGVVVHPRHVVGVIGTPELHTRWSWGIASFATGQLRYIMFTGSGSLIVAGCGDVRATSPGPGSTKMEQHLVMGFDSRLTLGVSRTEVFWPYLRGKTPLVADEFAGPHFFFWQKSSAEGPSNPLARSFGAVFSALGKVLGF